MHYDDLHRVTWSCESTSYHYCGPVEKTPYEFNFQVLRKKPTAWVDTSHHDLRFIWYAETFIKSSDGSTDKLATTTFVDTGEVKTEEYTSGKIYKDDIDVRLESILDFLEKPFLWNSTTWTTARVKNDVITSSSIRVALLSNPLWLHKLEGFSLIRGTACVRVQINSNPFQQGKLLLHYLPNVANHRENTYAAMHNACIATKVQQPHVEIDCSDAVGIIEMPFVAPGNWLNLNSSVYDSFDWGTFYLSVVSPLATGAAGETSVDATIYVYFKDVELSAPLVPQSSSGGPRTKGKRKIIKTKDLSTEESESLEHKPISTALRSVSKAANILGDIPLISSFAKPTAWALDLAAGVASFLGYSKPMNNVQPIPASRQFDRYLATSDGPINNFPLALRSDNAVSITDGVSYTTEDEMSLPFLLKVPALTSNFAWTTADISGTGLFTKSVYPLNLYELGSTTKTGHTVQWRAGGPLFYFARDFNLWRGSIKVTIKIVKTDLHVGRLELTWSPGQAVGTTPTNTTSQLALREIIDVRCGCEYTFCLPYMLDTEYVANTSPSGVLDIRVLNELRAPETCSTAVDVLVYFSAGDDLEFQAPGFNNQHVPIDQLPFSPEMNDKVISEGIGGEPCKSSISTIHSQMVNGESISSVKQILSRNMMISARTSMPVSAASASVAFWPWVTGIAYLSAGGILSGPNVGGDFYSKVAAMYAMYRGSMNVNVTTSNFDTTGSGRHNSIAAMIMPSDPNNAGVTALAAGNYLEAWPGTSDWLTANVRYGTQGIARSDAGIGYASYRVPYYGRTKSSFVCMNTTTNTVSADTSQPFSVLNLVGDQAFNSYTLARSIADDFQFCVFVGCPPLYQSYA